MKMSKSDIIEFYKKALTEPQVSEGDIEKLFPYEANRFMFKASDEYNKAQKCRREGFRVAQSHHPKPISEEIEDDIKNILP